jgi:flagellar biosynthesis/type III secretory pathway protein FliH
MPPVLKRGEFDPHQVARRLETVNVADHVGEARAVLKASQEQARQILAEAQKEAARLRDAAGEKGYEAGFRRGYEAGAKAGRDAAFAESRTEFAASQARLLTTLHELVTNFDRDKRDLFIAARQDVLAFALKAADKLTRRIGQVDRSAVGANLDAALRLVESKTDLVAHVNPLDVESAEQFAAAFKDAAEHAANFSILPDASITPGGCRLSTPDADVDATIDSQLAEIAAVMIAGKEKPA